MIKEEFTLQQFIEANMRIFNAYTSFSDCKLEIRDDLLKHLQLKALNHGLIIDPRIFDTNMSKNYAVKFVDMCILMHGISQNEMNSSLHKSWGKVKDAPLLQLVMEQIIHYMTTYGFQEAGCYSDDTVYVPYEKLELPEIKSGGINFKIIKLLDVTDLMDKIIKLVNSGIALKQETVDDVCILYHYINEIDIKIKNILPPDKIKNNEVKCKLISLLGEYPKDPVDFLRYIVYRITGKTLLIKSPTLYYAITNTFRDKAEKILSDDFINYCVENISTGRYNYKNINKLASIFNRFKPLFMIFKMSKDLSRIINKISRSSKVHHKPCSEDYINTITGLIKNEKLINPYELLSQLNKPNITMFKLIKLMYALHYRTISPKSIVHRIRNGMAHACEMDKISPSHAHLYSSTYQIVYTIFLTRLASKLSGKKVYIPENIRYGLPSTEKQFIGCVPAGTCITLPKNILIGVHWFNTDKGYVDLDLACMKSDGTKIGWDGMLRDKDGRVLFSGDITSAPKPNGGSEMFYFQVNNESTWIFTLNHYNRQKTDQAIPYTLLIGDAHNIINAPSKNYMMSKDELLFTAKCEIDVIMKTMGILDVTNDACKFYMAESNGRMNISSHMDEPNKHKLNYFLDYYKSAIDLNRVLKDCGCIMVNKVEDCDINLSVDALDKTTIIDLIDCSVN